jgi:D-threo-aldose 1-dehydrogenase
MHWNWHFIKKITDVIPLDWVMIANSMTLHSHPPDLLEYMKTLEQSNIAIINSAVFNGGFLTGGEYYNYKLVTNTDPAHLRLLEWRQQFFLLCEKHGIQPAHACVQFGLHAPGVTSVALSTTKAAKVKGNVEMATIPVPKAFWEEMKQQGLL